MDYCKVSVHRAPGSPGIALQMRDEIDIIDVEDIAYFPPRDAGGVKLAGDIVLLPDRYAISLYVTPGTAEVTSAAEGDTDQVGFKPQLKGNHPGNSIEVREFKANYLNRKVIVVMRYCNGRPADIIGSPCNPCVLTPSLTANGESTINEFTFAQISRGDDIGIYEGTLPREEAAGVVEADATKVVYTADGCYQLSGSAAISAIEGGQHGSVVTLLGTGGASSAPTVVSGGSLMLRDGKTFVGENGAQLTLRAFATSADSVVWIETDRYNPA